MPFARFTPFCKKCGNPSVDMLQHRILCCLQLLLAFQLFAFLVLQFLCDLIVLPCQLLILPDRFPAFIQQPLQRGKASPDLFDLSL